MTGELPTHYQTTIRRFLRFGVIGLALGMILGLAWTELGRSARYGEVNGQPQQVDPPEGRIKLELPPGYKWEAGLSFKLSHGHTILIAGLIPLCFAFTLVTLHQAGGKEISPGALSWALWPYVLGASGALAILLYKGVVGFAAVRGGNFDLAAIEGSLFAGSRALKGACYGTSHSAMAAGAFVLVYQVFLSAGHIGAPKPQDNAKG